MKILAAECSATPCSCAVMDNGKILASAFTSEKSTHSKTLLPMIEATLKEASLSLSDIDGFAITSGPGSFTGVRIGISLLKGLAGDKNCVGVSTLEVIAQNCSGFEGIICAVMDARCSQVYNALFRVSGGKITRLTEDRAILCQDLQKELFDNYSSEKIIISGDGTDCFTPFVNDMPNVSFLSGDSRYQNAKGVAKVAYPLFESGQAVTSNKLLPTYLRLPQAERELKLKTLKEGLK